MKMLNEDNLKYLFYHLKLFYQAIYSSYGNDKRHR